MKKIVLVALPVLLILSCTKNTGFPSTPQITLESVAPTLIHLDDSMVVELGFKDGNADVLDSVFFRENNTTRYSGFLSESIPTFPNKTDEQGNIIVTLDYINDIGQPTNPNGYPDTSTFSLFIKDASGNSSDTVTTPPIVIYQD